MREKTYLPSVDRPTYACIPALCERHLREAGVAGADVWVRVRGGRLAVVLAIPLLQRS